LNERRQPGRIHDEISSKRGGTLEMPQTVRETVCTMRSFVSPVLVTPPEVA